MKRSEQKLENTWKLEDIFPTENDFFQCLDSIQEQIHSLTKFKGTLHSASKLKEFLDKQFKAEEQLENCVDYASLKSDQDGSNSHCQNLLGKATHIATVFDSSLSFVNEEILALSKEKLSMFFKEEPDLLVYKRVIENIQRKKEHILSTTEEALLANAQETFSSAERTYYILNDTDLKFDCVTDSKDQSFSLTSGTYIDLVSNSDRTLRKNAFDAYYQSYKNLANTFAALLNSQCQQLKFNADARHYASSLEASLDQTQVPVSVYHNLIETVHKDIHILHKYMKVRKKLLNVDSVHMYDLYTPLLPSCDKTIPFEQAKEEVFDSVQLFGKEYTDIYKQGLNSRWIDVYENDGKRSGAYSNGANIHPFILLNHTPTLSSEFTLAHEMGHAMHSYLSNHHQPYCDSKYKIFVAEVASTCNEALLMHKLRSETTNPLEKAYLINYFLEQFRTTLFRQCMFAEFELKINEKVANHEILNVDILNAIYHDLNAFYYGEECTIDENIDYEWARIPHFYMNFYVYQYATGFSAAMALSQKLISGTQEDVNAYLEFLKGGCSKTPIELLKIAGIDITSPQPIHDALLLFDSLIDEFDEIISKSL